MLSSSGFRDALGQRDLRFNRESGEVHECLFLRPELAAYESALRRRVGRLASLEDPRLVVVEGLEHDFVTRRLAVVSRHASGSRIAEILRTAREREVVPDFTVSLFVTAELLMAARSFQSLSGLPHGAITPERIIVAPEGEVLLADYAYAEAIEAARFAPSRLWREFGIAAWLGEPFSFAGDVRQCALVGIALMLGRPLGPDAADRLESLLSEVDEAATIRGGRLFANPVMMWLRRAVAAGGPDGFDAAEDAAKACVALLTERERAAAPAAFLQFLAELDAPPTLTIVPDPEPIPQIGLSSEVLPIVETPAQDFGGYQGPGPEFQPITEPGPLVEDTQLEPDLISLLPPELQGPCAVEPEPEPAPEPAPVPTAEQPAPAAPREPAPVSSPISEAAGAGPRVNSPSPFAVAQRAPSLAAHVTPEAPPIAVPIARPVALPSAAPATVDFAKSDSTIRLKSDTPIKLKNPSTPKRERGTSLHLSDRPEPEEDASETDGSGGWHVPWKYVAAAVVVLAGGVAAATMDWGPSKPAAAVAATKPVEAPPPPAPTTGSIEVLSNTPGSKVLVDGKVRGETPLTVDDLKPGRHIVVVRAANGNVRRAVMVKVGETAKLDLAVYSGWVVVNAPIELQILESGKAIGTAGEGPIVLAAGHHTIEVVNEGLEYRSSHEVDIQPGEELRLDLNPKGLANLNAVPWAEVWLDGAKIGDTPLGNISVPLGTREFVFKNPQFGDRKVSTTITGSAAAQVSVDFTK